MSRRRSLLALAFVASAFALAPLSTAHADGPAAPAPAPAAVPMKAESPQRTQQVVNAVQAFYDRTQSFGCEFTQEFWVKAHNQKKSSRGKVLFLKPGKMEWLYDEPKENKVVSDGATLKVYEHENKQMYEQAVDKSQYPAALSFLTGQGKLSESFDFELFDGSQMAFPGGLVLVGKPKQPNPAYQKVLFYVDTQSSQVRRVLILDGQGNRNRFDFVNPKINLPVDANRFRFTPPQGTTIVKP